MFQRTDLLLLNGLKRPARQGDLDALFNLGLIFSADKHNKQDLQKAANYFSQAAEGGLARAQYELACAYQLGCGLPIDLEQAKYWFAKALAQGVTRAKKQLEA